MQTYGQGRAGRILLPRPLQQLQARALSGELPGHRVPWAPVPPQPPQLPQLPVSCSFRSRPTRSIGSGAPAPTGSPAPVSTATSPDSGPQMPSTLVFHIQCSMRVRGLCVRAMSLYQFIITTSSSSPSSSSSASASTFVPRGGTRAPALTSAPPRLPRSTRNVSPIPRAVARPRPTGIAHERPPLILPEYMTSALLQRPALLPLRRHARQLVPA
jgi:hypothetical protein